MATPDPSRPDGPCSDIPITLERLLELHQQDAACEVLVDAGAYALGAGEQWSRIRKVSPCTRFPITVQLAHGPATYRVAELRGVRGSSHVA